MKIQIDTTQNIIQIDDINGIPIYLDKKESRFSAGSPSKLIFHSWERAVEMAERTNLDKAGSVKVKMGSSSNAKLEVFTKQEVEIRGWIPISGGLYYPLTKEDALKQGWYKTDYGTWGYDPGPLC